MRREQKVPSIETVSLLKTSGGIVSAPAKPSATVKPHRALMSKANKVPTNPEVPKASLQSVEAHAFDTFGSAEKAEHWLNRPNHELQGKTPRQAMQSDPLAVEVALVRIDHGVYV